jgi:lipopolysaccharide/colanic/teichoic acid biosynthesis glycosyltransferase
MLQVRQSTIEFAPGEMLLPGLPAATSLRYCAAPAAQPVAGRDAAKRALDIVIALGALLLLSVPLLVAAIAIKLDSPGPVLFRQRRIGLHNRGFEMWKLRTMQCHPSDADRLHQATRHDPRVTRVGAVLRRLSLDEVPQCVQVLRGDMSMVGPRPHAAGTCAGGVPFEQLSDRYALRHRVLPGITGLAQVRGWRGETDTRDKLLRRLDSDLEYVATRSTWLDLRILARTAASVLSMRNAW